MSNRGILMFAYNNSEIDYLDMAVCNSRLIQKNLGLTQDQITIVTQEESHEQLSIMHGTHSVAGAANYIFRDQDVPRGRKNMRLYRKNKQESSRLDFRNYNRCDALELSPYDETILLDTDYVVLSNQLNLCWGACADLMMNCTHRDITNTDRSELNTLGPASIPMYWATVVYFRKTEFTRQFFDIVRDVEHHTRRYYKIYQVDDKKFRNDYAFSIAAHEISGHETGHIPRLPVDLYMSFDSNLILSAGKTGLTIAYSNSAGLNITQWSDTDIHVMSKYSLARHMEMLL